MSKDNKDNEDQEIIRTIGSMTPEIAAQYWKAEAEELKGKLEEAEAKLEEVERRKEDVDTFLGRVDFYRQIMAKCIEVAEKIVPILTFGIDTQTDIQMGREFLIQMRKMVAQSLFDRSTRYEFEKEMTHTLMDAVREINKPPESAPFVPMPPITGVYGQVEVIDEVPILVGLPKSLVDRIEQEADKSDPSGNSEVVKRALIDYFHEKESKGQGQGEGKTC